MACGVNQTSRRKRMGQIRFLCMSILLGPANIDRLASFEVALNVE
jgi:hypothetical protein